MMDYLIPWDEWGGIITPYDPTGKRGRPPYGIEMMLRMYLLQSWFNLSGEGLEDNIYDSYAFREFMKPDFGTRSTFPAPQRCASSILRMNRRFLRRHIDELY